MFNIQKSILCKGVGGALFLGAALFATSALAQAGPSAVPDEPGRIIDLPSGARGIVGLREAPDMPVDSIILRRAFPDHPVGLPARPGAPTPGEPPAGEEPPESAAQEGFCDTIGGLDYAGVLPVASQDNFICTNSDIDTYLGADGGTYAVQAGGTNAAWIVTDLSDPYSPVPHGPFCWVSGVTPRRCRDL